MIGITHGSFRNMQFSTGEDFFCLHLCETALFNAVPSMMKSSFLCNIISPSFSRPFRNNRSDCLRPKLWPDPTGQPADTIGYLIQLFFLTCLQLPGSFWPYFTASVKIYPPDPVYHFSPLAEGKKKQWANLRGGPTFTFIASLVREERKWEKWEALEKLNTLNKSRNVLPGVDCC